jgi:hypothetical protein
MLVTDFFNTIGAEDETVSSAVDVKTVVKLESRIKLSEFGMADHIFITDFVSHHR